MVNISDTEIIVSYIVRAVISIAIAITACVMLSRDSNTALWSGLLGTVLGLWFPNVSGGITTTMQHLIQPAARPMDYPAIQVDIPPPPAHET